MEKKRNHEDWKNGYSGEVTREGGRFVTREGLYKGLRERIKHHESEKHDKREKIITKKDLIKREYNENKKKINKLTGEHYSDEMALSIAKLSKNVHADDDDIDRIPEIVEGRKKVKGWNDRLQRQYEDYNSVKGTASINTPEREKKRDEVLDKMMKRGSVVPDKKGEEEWGGPVSQEKRMDIVLGLPSTGKSTAIANELSMKYQSKIIDSDEIKKEFDEFDHGYGAGVVHEESSDLADKWLDKTLENGDNMVIPKVGAKYDSIAYLIKLAKEWGYTVYVHSVKLPPNKALGRLLSRYMNQGRFLDPWLIYGNYAPKGEDKTLKVFEMLKENKDVKGWSQWDNDVPYGEKARMVGTNIDEFKRRK